MEGYGSEARAENGPALAGHGAKAVCDAIRRTIVDLPKQLRLSLTWDRGAEMAQHEQLRMTTDIQIYFCDPQSPWQRGSNENTNGLLRQYFPKGTDLSAHSKVRQNGRIISVAVVLAVGVNTDGRREILSMKSGRQKRKPSGPTFCANWRALACAA